MTKHPINLLGPNVKIKNTKYVISRLRKDDFGLRYDFPRGKKYLAHSFMNHCFRGVFCENRGRSIHQIPQLTTIEWVDGQVKRDHWRADGPLGFLYATYNLSRVFREVEVEGVGMLRGALVEFLNGKTTGLIPMRTGFFPPKTPRCYLC